MHAELTIQPTTPPNQLPKPNPAYWGLWNISTNLGGFLSPIIVGYVASSFGWQWGMWAPGLFGLLMGAAVMMALKDSPEELGEERGCLFLTGNECVHVCLNGEGVGAADKETTHYPCTST
jgi:MFS family permease